MGNSNGWPDLLRMSTASVYETRRNWLPTTCSQRFDHRLVDPLVEELHVFRAFFQHVAENAFQQPFGQFHVAPEVAKGHFRLDHPELGQVAGRVAVLGAEGRAKGVRLAQRTGERLGLELAADGQIGRPVEEIEREIDAAGPCFGTFFRSSVVTWNMAPAPSQSLAVMIGVWT